MKKLIAILIAGVVVAGCATPLKKTVQPTVQKPTIDCTKVSKMWWGQRGESPKELADLIQCYDWEIHAR
jgi:hypothetical protein